MQGVAFYRSGAASATDSHVLCGIVPFPLASIPTAPRSTNDGRPTGAAPLG